jgi:hypothetical protein
MVILILLVFDTRTWAGLSSALWRGASATARTAAPEAGAVAGGGGDA